MQEVQGQEKKGLRTEGRKEMNAGELILFAAAGYSILRGRGGTAFEVSSPVQGQTFKFKTYPASVTVSGASGHPVNISLMKGTTIIDTESLNPAADNTFSASLQVNGPGPHTVTINSKDQNGNEVTTTINFTVATEVVIIDPIERDIKEYRGVNFISVVLRQTLPPPASDKADLAVRMQKLKEAGINFLRVPFYWDHYLASPANTLAEVENITREAGRVGIAVQWDFHHFHTGMYNGGDGFPSQYTNAYPLDNTITKTSDKAWRFWQALIYDEIAGFRAAWWDVMQKMFDAAKNGNDFNNWVGVEFLNEPQVPPGKNGETNVQVFQRYKALYQFFADKFRARYGQDQFIVICEANGIGKSSTGSLMPPRDKQHLCFPITPNVVYAAHRYNTPLDDEFSNTIPLIIQNANNAGGDVRGGMVQEWALGGTGLDPPSLTFMREYMAKLAQYNLGWSIWAAWFKGENPRDLFTKNASGYAPSQIGQWVTQVIGEVYA